MAHLKNQLQELFSEPWLQSSLGFSPYIYLSITNDIQKNLFGLSSCSKDTLIGFVAQFEQHQAIYIAVPGKPRKRVAIERHFPAHGRRGRPLFSVKQPLCGGGMGKETDLIHFPHTLIEVHPASKKRRLHYASSINSILAPPPAFFASQYSDCAGCHADELGSSACLPKLREDGQDNVRACNC